MAMLGACTLLRIYVKMDSLSPAHDSMTTAEQELLVARAEPATYALGGKKRWSQAVWSAFRL